MKKKNKKSAKKMAPNNAFAYEPLSDRVLIKPLDVDEASKTKSGIYIPETASKDNSFKKGRVVAVGPGRYDEGKLLEVNLKVGDLVSFQWGEKITLSGEEYYLVREGEVAIRHN